MSPEAVDRLNKAVNFAFAEVAVSRRGAVRETLVAALDAHLIHLALSLNSDNQCEAAKLLGINRNTLRKRRRVA